MVGRRLALSTFTTASNPDQHLWENNQSDADVFWGDQDHPHALMTSTVDTNGATETNSCSAEVNGKGLCLYEQGKPSPYFTLILKGQVLIRTAAEVFVLNQGSWNYLGIEALSSSEWAPDYDAAAVPPYRLLRIHRLSYTAALDASLPVQVGF